MIDHYCCFNCPKFDKNTQHKLGDICQDCGEPYGFPLTNYPRSIGRYDIVKAIDRGFYSVTYKVTTGNFKDKFYALKVIPKHIYKLFKKDFKKECELHRQIISAGSQFIVGIDDYFDVPSIKFGKIKLDCHVAVLEFIEGKSIEKIIEQNIPIKAESYAQIALDLFSLLIDLKANNSRHNDLHVGNIMIQDLKAGGLRHGQINPAIRAVAIDMNSSVSSGDAYMEDRARDIQMVCRIIRTLCNNVYLNPDDRNDLSYRSANKLMEISHELDTKVIDYRQRDFHELIETIKTEFDDSQHKNQPWDKPFRIRHVDELYNAQSIQPWHINNLFVDPSNKWFNQISGIGPQIITGMRGCGKTILLKSLWIHARAVKQSASETKETIIKRISKDGFLGIYVSASRLLDLMGKETEIDPFSALFVGYLKSSLECIKHISDLDSTLIIENYYKHISALVSEIFPKESSLKFVLSDSQLNMALERIQYSLSNGEKTHIITGSPLYLFEKLTNLLKKIFIKWNNHHICFLLDDVSTRYIPVDLIKKLISQLLIQSEDFSFKITSESHTIAAILYSPGSIEKARVGRDYSIFDLGHEVKSAIHDYDSKNSDEFVEGILIKRLVSIPKYSNDPELYPKKLLGDKYLIDIARTIATATKTSRLKKQVYAGFTALKKLCVGDISDIINIYEKFVLKYRDAPLSSQTQHEVYKDFCNIRLYDLKRQKPEIIKYALGFAEASHELLVESYKNNPERVRQYNSIYVRFTMKKEEDQKFCLATINDMIDAGIFVPSGLTFRSKTHDTNPLLQFSLTYRKLFGLSNYIGLSESDRFELSGANLKEWLKHPEKCKLILKKNLSKIENTEELEEIKAKNILIPTPPQKTKAIKEKDFEQLRLGFERKDLKPIKFDLYKDMLPKVDITSSQKFFAKTSINQLLLGLGFEDRAYESITRYAKVISPKKIILVKYKKPGLSKKILQLIKNEFPNTDIEEQKYDQVRDAFEPSKGNILIDVSGLSKALIFNTIRKSIMNRSNVSICHTEAESYFPTDQEVLRATNAYKNKEPYEFFDAVNGIFGGEKPPFKEINLLETNVDESRSRVLIAFARPKNERLYHILDNREYDKIEIITPIKDKSPRSGAARIAIELISKKYNNTNITEFDSNDLDNLLPFLAEKYQEYYADLNYNVEIALTGSKRQTIAAAILSTFCKFSKVWYIKPHDIDPKRFSKGVGVTNFIRVNSKK